MSFSRPSGRDADQLRPVTIQRGFTRHAEGSVLIGFGDTRVLCTASVENKVPAFMRGKGFAAGSMGPKVEAACRFVELTGDTAAIGRLEDAEKIIAGEAGTIITPGGNYGGPDDIRPPLPEPVETRKRRA